MIIKIFAALSGLLPAGFIAYLAKSSPMDLPWANLKGISPETVSLAAVLLLAVLGIAALLGLRLAAWVLFALYVAGVLAAAFGLVSVLIEENFRLKDLGPMVVAVYLGGIAIGLVFIRVNWAAARKKS